MRGRSYLTDARPLHKQQIIQQSTITINTFQPTLEGFNQKVIPEKVNSSPGGGNYSESGATRLCL